MFQDFARSAEAMFSRWAIKRICKFILKKRLGNLILGDVDLEQLDVRLSSGTIQLADLALNVDYLNQKLIGAPVLIKEGSIASLSIKVPWKLQNCYIELEELELVIIPYVNNKGQNTSCLPTQDGKDQGNVDSDSVEQARVQGSLGSTFTEIHEGVKQIAKIVKWLLTNFHVKLKNLIVAFDPCIDVGENKNSLKRSLVLRITELEYGTCVSEDICTSDSQTDSVLGIGRLTNFIKFEGAVVESLQMDDIDRKFNSQNDLGTSFSEWCAENSPSGCASTILMGPDNGFSGKVNLSIPWKNGSLDIRKVDADIAVDPVKIQIEKSTITWIMTLYESLKNASAAGRSHNNNPSLYNPPNCRAHISFPASNSILASAVRMGDLSNSSCADACVGSVTDAVLQKNFIQNWVPYANQEDQVQLDDDYGSSVDQFFECFDGLRSSQGNFGNSGILNWTCSVFNAITFASSLASGSVNIPPDQHNLETNIQASIGEISVIFSLKTDENTQSPNAFGTVNDYASTIDVVDSSLHAQNSESYMSCISSLINDQSTSMEPSIQLDVHHLEVKCQRVLLKFLQTSQQNIKFEASVEHIVLDELYDIKNANGATELCNCSCIGNEVLCESLQEHVLGSLPSFPRCHHLGSAFVFGSKSASTCSNTRLVKVNLLRSFGVFSCCFEVRSADFDGKCISSTSFSLNFPTFILWVDFHLIVMLLNIFKEIQNSLRSNLHPLQLDGNGIISHDDSNDAPNFRNFDCKRAIVHGTLEFTNSRIILCFLSKNLGNSRHFVSSDTFIAVDFLHSASVDNVRDANKTRQTSQSKDRSSTSSNSIHVKTGTVECFLVASSRKCFLNKEENCMKMQAFSDRKILLATNSVNTCLSEIVVRWQNGPVTAPWIASRTWSLATMHNQRTKKRMTGKRGEFSYATTVEDIETNSQARQELILSSAFVLHIQFSHIWIDLESSDYKLLKDLFIWVENVLADTKEIHTDSSPCNAVLSQSSVLVECCEVDIHMSLNEAIDASNSIQKELPGLWNFLRLKIDKFELLNVSNVGGVAASNYLWLSHSEGELWGSFNEGCEDSSLKGQDFLLLACKNSNVGRGNGEGTNPLSFGCAGTTVTYICNPQLLQSFTSIMVRCGTMIAPGGRLDWINAIVSFFASSSHNEDLPCCNSDRGSPDKIFSYKKSFFLELVDFALIYKPHVRNDMSDCVRRFEDAPNNEAFGSNDLQEQYVSCLLAAASLNLYNHSTEDSSSNEYRFQLQDLGLLISEYSDMKCRNGEYSVHHLRQSGYVKFAHEALVLAVLYIEGSNWFLEFSDSHIDLGTCHDTFRSLIRLIAQLQLLYAPNIEDALMHLQSRWTAIHPGGIEKIDASDTIHNYSEDLSCETIDVDNRYDVLIDEMLENAFNMRECDGILDYWGSKTLSSNGTYFPGIDGCKLMAGTASNSFIAVSKPVEGSNHRTEIGPHIIEGFYLSENISSSMSSPEDVSPKKIDNSLYDNISRNRYSESGKGRWYDSGPTMIVENHVTEVLDQHFGGHVYPDETFVAGDSTSVDTCMAKGRVSIKNFIIRWKMYAGFDWPKPRDNIYETHLNKRNDNSCLELVLSGVNLQFDIFPNEHVCVSKLAISVQDFHLYDCSTDAPWKMVLGYYHSKDHPRQSHSKAFKLNLEAVKPVPSIPIEEYRMIVELLPIRLHLDQSQLNFLTSFFRNDLDVEVPCGLSNDNKSEISGSNYTMTSEAVFEEALLPFFQKCDVKPILIRVDYIPRHIDLASLKGGNYAELLNLVPWKGVELQLKHVSAGGLFGFSSLCEAVIVEWLDDISSNQVHKLLKGLPPLRSLIAVSSGASKLVTIPIKSYKKDQKLLKGIQRAASAFTRSISLEAVTLGVHLAGGLYDVLLQTEYILRTIPPSTPSNRGRRKTRIISSQPKDARQGIQQACDTLSDGLARTASTLVGSPLKAYQRGAGARSVLATAIRAVPAAVVAPVSASARAVHCALLGVRNSLDPEHQRESMEKYSGPSGS